MKKITVFWIAIITSTICFAGAAEGAGAPLGKIGIQALNLGILVAALTYFVRGSLIEAFAQRQASFKEQSQKTASALLAAEAQLKDIKDKLFMMDSTEASSIEKASAEAENVKLKIIQEAGVLAEKMKTDVQFVIAAELYKARVEIRNQIIEKSIASAKDSVFASSQTITEKSEKGFVSDLGQVKA